MAIEKKMSIEECIVDWKLLESRVNSTADGNYNRNSKTKDCIKWVTTLSFHLSKTHNQLANTHSLSLSRYIYIYIYIYMKMFKEEKTQGLQRMIIFIQLSAIENLSVFKLSLYHVESCTHIHTHTPHTHTYTHIHIHIYIYIYIQGAHNKFPDFFSYGHFYW